MVYFYCPKVIRLVKSYEIIRKSNFRKMLWHGGNQMKKTILLCAILLCFSFAFIGCKGTTLDQADGTESNIEETVDNVEQEKQEEVATNANLLESWDLSDGGRTGNVSSSIGKTAGTTRWGTWLRTETFGFTLDFSTEGSYFKAENVSLEEMSDSFTISSWLKAPPREDNTRVIVSKGVYDSSAPLEYSDFKVLHTCNIKDGWKRLNNKVTDYEDESCSDGHCLELTGDQNAPLIFALQFEDQDFSSYDTDDAYIRFRFYVDDASKLITGELELGSQNTSDSYETAWLLDASLFKDGWNEILLPLSGAHKSGDGGCDLSGVNFTRLYMYVTGPATIRLDEIAFCRVVQSDKTIDFALYLESESGNLGFMAPGLSGLENTDVSLIDGKWHHVAVTLNNGSFTYHVDGEAVKTLAVTGSLTNDYSDIYAGAYPDATGGFDGSMAQLKLYSGVASAKNMASAVTVAESDNTFDATAVELLKGIWIEPSNLQDLKNVKDMGFGHVRHGFDPDRRGEIYINEDGSLNLEAMQTVEKWINNCVRAGLPVIMGPHPVYEWKEKWITDLEKFELLCDWYGDFAAYIAERWTPQQVALTIMSEPAGGNPSVSWTWVSDRVYTAMRNAAPDHTILMGGDASGNIEKMKAMSPVTDDNVKYSFSTYEPYTIGFGTATTGMGGQVTFWNYLGDVPYPVPEGLTDEEIEEIVEDVTSLEPADFKTQAQDVVRKYLKGISDAGDHYVNNYGGVYNKAWHIRRAESVKAWQDKYGGVNVHVSEVGTIDAVQSIQYFQAVEGSGASMETHYNHLRDLVTTFIDYGFGYDYCGYNNPELTVFDTRLRTGPYRYGNGLSSDLALSWYDYDKLDILQVTPVREYHPASDFDNALIALRLNDEESAETAASELLLGITAEYGKIKTVADDKFGRAAQFMGETGANIISNNASLDMPDGMAVSAWIKADNATSGNKQTIVTMTENMQKAEDGTVGKIMVSDCETSIGWWGISDIGTIERQQSSTEFAIVTEAAQTVIFCNVYESIDITSFLDHGYLSIDIYCEDASEVSSVMLDFGSNRGLLEAVSWFYNGSLSDGWNTVKIKLSDNPKWNGADPAEISYLRFVGCTPETTLMGIDNIYFELDPENAKGYDYWDISLDGEGYLILESDKFEGEARSDKAITDTRWHHVVVSYDGNAFTYYIDGEEAGSFEADTSFVTPSSADLVIGSDGEGKCAYSGLIANVRIYNAAKTPTDVTPAE